MLYYVDFNQHKCVAEQDKNIIKQQEFLQKQFPIFYSILFQIEYEKLFDGDDEDKIIMKM